MCLVLGISNYDGDNAISLRRILVQGLHRILPSRVSFDENEASSSDLLLQQNIYSDGAFVDEKLNVECLKLVDHLQQINGEPVKIG